MMRKYDSGSDNVNSDKVARGGRVRSIAPAAMAFFLFIMVAISIHALPIMAAGEVPSADVAPVFDSALNRTVVATGTLGAETVAATSGFATATPATSGFATPTEATKTLYQQFYDESMSKCMAGEVSEDAMNYMLKHFDQVQDGLENKTIQYVIGCLALEREDQAYCEKFKLMPDSVKSIFPYETSIESCKEKVKAFIAIKDAFSGNDCRPKMEAYCKDIDKCGLKSPDGKICTCPLYAAYNCGIASCNSIEQCANLKPEIVKVLSGYDQAVVDKMVDAVNKLCLKVVLGASPMENEHDIGAAITLFLSGLFAGAKWPVYSENAKPEDFGTPLEIAYWYDYVYKHKTTCLKHLDIIRADFCAPYSSAIAKEMEEAALKKMKEEAESKKKENESKKGEIKKQESGNEEKGKNEKVKK